MKLLILLTLPFVLAVATASAIPQPQLNPLEEMEARRGTCGQLCLGDSDCGPPCVTCSERMSVCGESPTASILNLHTLVERRI